MSAINEVAMAPFCGFCGDHMHLRDAKGMFLWLRFWRPPHHDEQIREDHACERCHTAAALHISRFTANSDALASRRKGYAFPCRYDNSECFQWHHATQERCDCACHDPRSARYWSYSGP
jgi:hypothetical protein